MCYGPKAYAETLSLTVRNGQITLITMCIRNATSYVAGNPRNLEAEITLAAATLRSSVGLSLTNRRVV